jgi:hypothetical protein
MSCRIGSMMDPFEIQRAIAAKEQPRQATNGPNRRRRALPHADPIYQQQSSLLHNLSTDCRLLVLEYVLRESQIRIERWRPPSNVAKFVTVEGIDADCFPYRITTARAEKTEKPLNTLLCCRQLYVYLKAMRHKSLNADARLRYLEGLTILYSTSFVFECPLDLYNFQLCVSPEGLSRVRGLIIALGQVDCARSGPFFFYGKHPHGSLDEWRNAIHGLKQFRRLQELQVFLGHRHVQIPELERRPWKEDRESQTAEERHYKLFNLFGAVKVPNFTIYLTWKPEDVLSQRLWPFKIQLQTKDEMLHVIDKELPEKTEPDIYDWGD